MTDSNVLQPRSLGRIDSDATNIKSSDGVLFRVSVTVGFLSSMICYAFGVRGDVALLVFAIVVLTVLATGFAFLVSMESKRVLMASIKSPIVQDDTRSTSGGVKEVGKDNREQIKHFLHSPTGQSLL